METVRKTADGETFIIELEEKKSKTGNQFKRFIYALIGIFGMLISVVLCFTIIGIIPGLGLGFFSLLFLYSAMGKQIVQCPNCNRKQPVVHNTEGFICRKCKKHTIVEWKK